MSKLTLPHITFPHVAIAQNVIIAAGIILLIFALVLVMAYMSRSFMSWSLSGAGIGIFVGFLLAIILEGFLLIGGKTVITAALGWKSAPAPILNVLNTGHKQLLDALNVPASCSGIVK